MSVDKKRWMESWERKSWVESKEKRFRKIDEYLEFKPKKILDIGCGVAIESGLFQKKYGSELYLLDSGHTGQGRDTGYYSKSGKFGFYLEEDYLKESWDKRGMKYTFLDASDLQMPDIKFDLIYSLKSCGFHYCFSTYKELVKNHSDENTVCIFDFERAHFKEQKKKCGFEVIDEVDSGKAHLCKHIKV